MKRLLMVLLLLCAVSCATPIDELRGVAELPPVDRTVLVTGGAFLTRIGELPGTFESAPADEPAEARAADPSGEGITFVELVDTLARANVFQRVVADDDDARRRRIRRQLESPSGGAQIAPFLQQARADGFDLLLVIEELNDGPIETIGTNDRWPVTFATWILLGVGAFIPDRTFESRAAMRVSLRELQTGRSIYEYWLVPGQVDLALTERTDLLGLAMSILVPPFWVGDDPEAVRASVRETAERRLLLSLARELKSEVTRRRIDEAVGATIRLRTQRGRRRIVVSSAEGVSVVRLAGADVDAAASAAFQAEMLASRAVRDGRYVYRAELPSTVSAGLVQVRIGTLSGVISSATFSVEERP